ncbi:hypothetical protein K1T71_006560 [Dendrolimus kikuchii]|uniref:Uncharacterized protein n=1 Tax=Dendrolimus kikuchii TaxID=765133 RepID=A0ACC1D2C3_9NEOP|nr:hypothetical protein K1T71_006560 [Dendrolimus kikuchii]
MAALAKKCGIGEEPLKKLWLNRLPPGVRAVLTVSAETKIEDFEIARQADRILENLGRSEIATVQPSTAAAVGTMNGDLLSQFKELAEELRGLRGDLDAVRDQQRNGPPRENQRNRGRFRPRNQPPKRRTPNSPDWLWRHYYRYRERARDCEEPCNWQRNRQSSGN